MKKIMYLHGFASSGASGTVGLLRQELWEKMPPDRRVTIVAPDIPLDPLVALPMLEELAYDEMPDLVIGTSMGGMYAQMLHGFTRICVNPAFWISKKYDILFVGKHKWMNQRKDGETEFHVTKDTIAHFQEMEAHQFEGVANDAGDVFHVVGTVELCVLRQDICFNKFHQIEVWMTANHKIMANIFANVRKTPYICKKIARKND